MMLIISDFNVILHVLGDFMCKINLEVMKKVVPLHSRLRNGH